MGAVYRARDTTLKRDVAPEVLPATFLRDRERMARFQCEPRFWSRSTIATSDAFTNRLCGRLACPGSRAHRRSDARGSHSSRRASVRRKPCHREANHRGSGVRALPLFATTLVSTRRWIRDQLRFLAPQPLLGVGNHKHFTPNMDSRNPTSSKKSSTSGGAKCRRANGRQTPLIAELPGKQFI